MCQYKAIIIIIINLEEKQKGKYLYCRERNSSRNK